MAIMHICASYECASVLSREYSPIQRDINITQTGSCTQWSALIYKEVVINLQESSHKLTGNLTGSLNLG